MSSTDLQNALQALLDKAVADNAAPALQCIVLDKEKVLYNAISGFALTPSDSPPHGKPFTSDHSIILTSCTKIILSIVTLSVLEKGQAKNGMGIEHLDDHDKLVEILPEFSPSSGSLLTKILEGFENGLDADGRKIMKLRDAKTKITLRMMLTHTTGMVCDWTNALLSELFTPTDGSVPHRTPPWISGRIADHITPLIHEPNTVYSYSTAPDWIGEFLVRSTGKSIRRLYREHICDPLGIPYHQLDVFISPEIEEHLAGLYKRGPDGNITKTELLPYATEDIPPPGHMIYASASLWGNLLSYSKVLQAALNEDTRLLSKKVWEIAIRDDLQPRGLKVPSPEMPWAIPALSKPFDDYIETIPKHQIGANLLQAKVAISPTVTGRSAGSFGWAGATNSHWVVDPHCGIVILFGAHFLPFMDRKLVQTRDEVEKLIYSHLGRSTRL